MLGYCQTSFESVQGRCLSGVVNTNDEKRHTFLVLLLVMFVQISHQSEHVGRLVLVFPDDNNTM